MARVKYSAGPGGVRRGKIWNSGTSGRPAPLAVYSSGEITSDKAGRNMWFFAAGINFINNPLPGEWTEDFKKIQAQRLAYVNEIDNNLTIGISRNLKYFEINNPLTGKIQKVHIRINLSDLYNYSWTPSIALRTIYIGPEAATTRQFRPQYWETFDGQTSWVSDVRLEYPFALSEIEEYNLKMTVKDSEGVETLAAVPVLIARKMISANNRIFYNVILLKSNVSSLVPLDNSN